MEAVEVPPPGGLVMDVVDMLVVLPPTVITVVVPAVVP